MKKILLRIFELNIYDIICASIIAIIYDMGFKLQNYESLFPNLSYDIYLKLAVRFLLIWILVYIIICGFNYLITNYKINNSCFAKKVKISKIFIFILGMHTFWYILLWPGIVTYDSYNQISQALGWIPLANNNPVFHTMLMSIIIKPVYLLFGSINICIGVWMYISIIIFSAILSYVMNVLIKLKIVDKIIMVFLGIFYLINPLVGFYTMIMWKDIWISYFTLLFITCLYVNYKNINCPANKYVLAISLVGVLFSKGTGIIYVLCAMPFVFLEKNIRKKVKVILLFGSCICLYLGSVQFVTNIMSVEKHSVGDTLSIIWQTTARTVKEHGDELEKEEIIKINEFINVEVCKNLYDPSISDPVKAYADGKKFMSNLKDNMFFWFKLGIKYPKSYIDAIVSLGYGYYYPEINYWCYTSADFQNTAIAFKNNNNICFDPDYDENEYRNSSVNYKRKCDISADFSKLREIPIISLVWKIGTYFIMYFYFFMFAIRWNDKVTKRMLFIILGIFLVCILSPVFAEMRYAYPAILIFPIMLLFVYYERANDR